MSELNFGRLLRRAEMFADQPAMLDLGTGHESTYREHLDRVERLAAAIADLGVGPAGRLGVMAGAGHTYIELWRACLSGAAVINPLNTRLTADEITYILDDSGTEVVMADAAAAAVLDGVRDRLPRLRTVVLIGTPDGHVPHDVKLDDALAATTPAGLPPEPSEDAAAVLMYTGGTTGLPKGVLLSQRAITLLVHRMQMSARFAPEQSFLSFMPMFHIGGVAGWGLYLPTGGRSVVLPAFEPAAVNAAIRNHRITTIGAVPTMLAFMLGHPDFEPKMFASLQLIMYGAAAMPPELLARLMDVAPKVSFFQVYGMTECAAAATALVAADHRRGGEILGSVGRPMVGVEIDIRDPATAEPLPRGEIGEIWLRCDSVMTEYWRTPRQTADSLVDGWYRSGDAGRLDDAGYLYMADRVKDMIVSGGENIYSLEVENAVSSHPAVTQVAVVGVPDPTWGEVVHAVVVCDPASVTADELDGHTRQAVAGYKVPKQWTLRAEPLPLSAAGKVLKVQLRAELSDGG